MKIKDKMQDTKGSNYYLGGQSMHIKDKEPQAKPRYNSVHRVQREDTQKYNNEAFVLKNCIRKLERMDNKYDKDTNNDIFALNN